MHSTEPFLDAADIAILLTAAKALMNLGLVFYFTRLAINLYRTYRLGANHLTLSMVFLYSTLALAATWRLIVSIIESPIVGIYEVSWTYIMVLSLETFFSGLILLSCWHFDMALFRIAVQEEADEKAKSLRNNEGADQALAGSVQDS